MYASAIRKDLQPHDEVDSKCPPYAKILQCLVGLTQQVQDIADIRYMLSPTSRLPDFEQLIEQRNYFVVHAPRQTGKTTTMLALAKQLTEGGRYTAVTVSVEVGSAFNHDPGTAELAIIGTWRDTIADGLPKDLQPPVWDREEPGRRILRPSLRTWA